MPPIVIGHKLSNKIVLAVWPIGFKIVGNELRMIVRTKIKTELMINPPVGWTLDTRYPGRWRPDFLKWFQ